MHLLPRDTSIDRAMLDRAARLALRAAGDAEPNPLVGCVIGRESPGKPVETLGLGHHRRFGEAHAEVEALADCRRRAADPRGATAWVTLEPCAHTGKTGPCADALIAAGVARVVIARADPNPLASGGGARLRAAGVDIVFTNASPAAMRLTDPFVKRIQTGLPWIIAKWAQTMDGRVATRTRESKWITNERSRAATHRLRARVDAVVTGIGTVLADDPLLTARSVRRVRRVAARVVIDPRLELPLDSSLVRTIAEAPVICVCAADLADAPAARALAERGVEIWPTQSDPRGVDTASALRRLAAERAAANVLIESGPGLLGRIFEAGLADEAWVFVAPMTLADGAALSPVGGASASTIAGAARFKLDRIRRFGDDALLQYRRAAPRPPGA